MTSFLQVKKKFLEFKLFNFFKAPIFGFFSTFLHSSSTICEIVNYFCQEKKFTK